MRDMSSISSDSDDEVSVFAPNRWSYIEWRAGPPRPLPQQESLLAPLMTWARAHLAKLGDRRGGKPPPPQMHMGETMNFYWSNELGGYVERGKEDEYRARLAKPSPPPKAVDAPMSSSSSAAPPARTRGRKYVDAQGQRVAPVMATHVPVVTPPWTPSPPTPQCVMADKVAAPTPVPSYLPCMRRPFALKDPIDLPSYDWAAALAEFEQSVLEVEYCCQ